jgi:hypothetical protein
VISIVTCPEAVFTQQFPTRHSQFDMRERRHAPSTWRRASCQVLLHYLAFSSMALQLRHDPDMILQKCPLRRWSQLDGTITDHEQSTFLATTLSAVSDSFASANVTYMLLPGSGLIPSKTSPAKLRFTEWHRGTAVGVLQKDMMRVLLAISSLDDISSKKQRISAVETFSGLRLYPPDGTGDPRLDYKEPYVDVMFLTRINDKLINSCCDCDPIKISSCTKRTCGCKICAYDLDAIFPLSQVRIHSVMRPMPVPRDRSSVLLPEAIPGVDPLFAPE